LPHCILLLAAGEVGVTAIVGGTMAKTAFITGASYGIGRALALELAGRGWDLGLAARRLRALKELKTEILARTVILPG